MNTRNLWHRVLGAGNAMRKRWSAGMLHLHKLI